MLSAFTWTGTWQGTILFEKALIPNEWTVTLKFNGEADDPYEEQVAFDRCRAIVEERYQDSLFVNLEDSSFNKLRSIVNSTIITLPDEPVDTTIAVATLNKFSRIVEGRLSFDSISISSRLSDSVELYIPIEALPEVTWLNDNPIQKMTGEPGWFMRTNAGITDHWIKTKSKHEIIRDMEDWKTLGLDWDPEENIKQSAEPIEMPEKPRPRFKGWKPKVITGGKK